MEWTPLRDTPSWKGCHQTQDELHDPEARALVLAYSRFQNIVYSLSEQPHASRSTQIYGHLHETRLTTTTMGRKLAADVLNRVIIHFEAGETVPMVYNVTKVAKSCLYKLRLNIDL
jgi:hypothetical protein